MRGTLAAWRERGWESPNSDEGTYIVVICKYMYFVSNREVNSKAEATGVSQAPTKAGKLATAEMFAAVGTPATSDHEHLC